MSFSTQMDDLSRTLATTWRNRRADVRAKALQWANNYLFDYIRLEKLMFIRDDFIERVKNANLPMDLYVPVMTYSRVFRPEGHAEWDVIHNATHQGAHVVLHHEMEDIYVTLHEVVQHTDLLLRLNHLMGPKFALRAVNTRVVESVPYPGYWIYEYEIRVEFWPNGYTGNAAAVREVGEKYRDYVDEGGHYYNGGVVIVKNLETCPHCAEPADTGTIPAVDEDNNMEEFEEERRTAFCRGCEMWLDRNCFGIADQCYDCEQAQSEPAHMDCERCHAHRVSNVWFDGEWICSDCMSRISNEFSNHIQRSAAYCVECHYGECNEHEREDGDPVNP